MATVTIFDQMKKEVGSLELSPEIFEVEVRPEILHFVVRAQLAAKRAGTHSAKTRAFVSGRRQEALEAKGTATPGLAPTLPCVARRRDHLRPQPRSYEFKVNRKVRRLALKMALTSRLLEDNLMVLKGIDMPEIKTKSFAEIVKNLGLEKALIVFKEADNNLLLSARNVPGIKLLPADKINAYDVLLYPKLVMLENAAVSVQERLK
jgi:large subunit ribosomal protein L4